MSEELKALDNMRADVIAYRDLTEVGSYSTDEDYKLIKKLLKRNEPTAVSFTRFTNTATKISWHEPACPKCKSFVVDKDKFCYECGQKLDWEKQNE